MHSPAYEAKAQLRRTLLRQRKALAATTAQLAAAQVVATLRQALAHWSAAGGMVGAYWPIGAELDLRELLQGPGGWALPAIRAGGLQFQRWHPGDPLEADACGVPAPCATAAEVPAARMALVLVPCLGLSRRGIRLGYGGGWFDRMFAEADWRGCPRLGVLMDAFTDQPIPRDPWDQPLHGWVSEVGLTWLRPPMGWPAE